MFQYTAPVSEEEDEICPGYRPTSRKGGIDFHLIIFMAIDLSEQGYFTSMIETFPRSFCRTK